MSFRIITYRDPYHLENTSFWSEIRDLPHFCASSVMAMSLWDMYKDLPAEDRFGSFFFPLDDLVKATYNEWEGNIEKQILQYSALSRQLREWERADHGRRPELFSALQQNKSSLLEALRMFAELNIDPQSLNKDLANTEQKVFISLYYYITRFAGNEEANQDLINAFAISDRNIYQNRAFPALVKAANDTEQKKLKTLSEKERTDQITAAIKKREVRLERLKELEASFAKQPPRKIVIHGIHQFKPLQIRLIAALDAAGYEIIFLYNYLKEHRHIYETWERIYSLFDVPIENSQIIKEYAVDKLDKTSNDLSGIVAGLLNARAPVKGTDRKKWLEQTKDVSYTVFENTSEMANYVAELMRLHKKPGIPNELLVENLPEKFYSASRDADDLLKVYFPEYAGERHFLQYPIGQFFANLYQMWNDEKRQLELDVMSMKACAVSGMMVQDSGERLSGLLDLVSPLLEDVSLYEDVEKRLQHYKKAYEAAQHDHFQPRLKHMALYNKGQITENDIQELIDFLHDLKDAADTIFNQEGQVDFRSHFENLENYIKSKSEHLAREQERSLVDDLLTRFDSVAMKTTMSGTMEDLRQGLYFYLAQKKDEKPGWVVRNFEQIEGDILKSKEQIKREGNTTYHFAALSDGMICKKTDDILPWPLTDRFTHVVYSPVAMVFQVYYCALCDRSAYMQYALFYGLHFNRGHVKLSYVRHLEEKKEEQFYYPLQILNLRKENYQSAGRPAGDDDTGKKEEISLSIFEPQRYERMDFFLCPYRYYLDFICSSEIVHTNPFLIRKFYQAMLANIFRAEYQNKKMQSPQIKAILEQYQKQLDQYFPFLMNINDKPDICDNATKYILHNMIDPKTGKVQEDHPHHGTVREIFIKAAFYEPEDAHQPHPVEELREYVEHNPVEKPSSGGKVEERYEYSLMKVLGLIKKYPMFEKAMMRDYLLNSDEHLEHPGEWCNYCRYKGLCKKPYTKTIEE